LDQKRQLVLAFFLTTIGTLIFALAQSYAVACLGRVIIGVGVSAPVVCASKLLPAWFEETKIQLHKLIIR